jgi:hypothetical protein
MDPAIIVFIVFSSMATVVVVISLVAYFCKRLEHKEILAAIEKGTPLSELKSRKLEPAGPVWVRYLTGGIIFFFVGLAFLFGGPVWDHRGGIGPFVAFILCGVGIAWLLRGLLYRKYEKQGWPSVNDSASVSNSAPEVSTPEVMQQPGQ